MARTVKLKLGLDRHELVKNTEDKNYCTECSIRSICFDMGQTSRMSLCNALLRDIYEYPDEFSPYGGHFELK